MNFLVRHLYWSDVVILSHVCISDVCTVRRLYCPTFVLYYVCTVRRLYCPTFVLFWRWYCLMFVPVQRLYYPTVVLYDICTGPTLVLSNVCTSPTFVLVRRLYCLMFVSVRFLPFDVCVSDVCTGTKVFFQFCFKKSTLSVKKNYCFSRFFFKNCSWIIKIGQNIIILINL